MPAVRLLRARCRWRRRRSSGVVGQKWDGHTDHLFEPRPAVGAPDAWCEASAVLCIFPGGEVEFVLMRRAGAVDCLA